MLDKIISFSLRNRLLIIVLAFAIVIGGCWTASRMEVDVFPDLNATTVVVMTEAGGMAPEEVEMRITYPIETAVNGSMGVRRVRSQSSTGFSVVWVEFDWDTDVYRARQIVSEKLATLSDKLPPEAGEPSMGPQSSILGEVLFVGLTSDKKSIMELREMADATVVPRLLSIPGVAQVSVNSEQAKLFAIELDLARMRRLDVSLNDVVQALDGFNSNFSGGVLNEYGNEYLIRGVTSTNNVEELGTVAVTTAVGNSVLLSEIADVKVASQLPETGTASIDGKKGVILTITKQQGVATIDITKNIEDALADLKPQLGADVAMNTDLYRQKDFIDASINNIKKSLIEGGIFVAIILFIFLLNYRTALISLVTIPISLLVTILTLKFMGLTINTMSIGGIAIAIGSLVDDAIVDVENVYKRIRANNLLPEAERLPLLKVIFEASREVRMPILNSTLIIIVSFIPLFFLDGIEGRMLVPLGVAFIISLFASTLVALSLTPVLCSYLLSKSLSIKEEPKITRKMKQLYAKGLDYSLNHAKPVIGVAVGLFVIALAVFFNFGRSFLPSFNEGSFTINISAMPGISLEESDMLAARAEKILMEVPEVKHVARKTGRAEMDEHALGINVSEFEVPFEIKDRGKDKIADEIRERLKVIPGVNIEIGQPISHRIDAMLSGTQANVAIKVFGTDLNKMYEIGKEIKSVVDKTEGFEDVNVELQVERPQIKIKPKREVLARYGIPMNEFSAMLSTLLSGQVVGQVFENNRSYDIVLRLAEGNRADINDIRAIGIRTATGETVPLEYVAEVTSSTGPNTINREANSRKLVVSANISGRDQRSAVNEIKAEISKEIELPEHYHIEYGGQFESEESASRLLLGTSFVSIIAIFLLLFNQFRSWSQSLVVMINLPLALIGGVAAIALSSRIISIPAIIGFISLFGIATRNGMLLIDRFNTLTGDGMELRRAIVEGSADRLNPIIMTALTSALALVPLAAGGALPGNEIQSPMAKVILGGLISSTFLNLFVVPVVYLLMNSPKSKLKKQ